MRWMSGCDDNYKRWWWRWSLLSRQPTPAASFLHHWWYCKLVDSGPTCPAHNYHYHYHDHYHDGNDDTFEHKSWFCYHDHYDHLAAHVLSIPIGESGAPRLVVVSVNKYAPGVLLSDKNMIHDMSLVWHSSIQLRSLTLTYPRYSTSL